MARILAGAKGSLVGTDLLRPRALRAPSPRVELPVPRVERAEPRLQDGKDTSMCEPMELPRFDGHLSAWDLPVRSWLILSDSFPEVLARLGPAGGRPGRSPAQAACARSNSIGER